MNNKPSPLPSPGGRGGSEYLGIVALIVFAVAIHFNGFPASGEEALPPQLDEATGRGLSFLARQQNVDGSFESGGPKLPMSGLALLAFLSSGHTADVGRYGLVVRNTIDYLLAQAQPDGTFGKVEDRYMYVHGIVTLALAEAYGAETNADERLKLHGVVSRAVGVILKAQGVQKEAVYAGGWRYLPTAPDSDISLSGWNALALRAAQDAGLQVPKEAVQHAVEFVIRCYKADAHGFAYQPQQAPQLSCTGVGVLCLYLLDAWHGAEAAGGVKYLAEHPIDDHSQFPYYSLYYTTQAAYQAGDETWRTVSKATFEKLLKSQEQEGGWPQSTSGQEPGKVYSTSMALLTLSVPYRLLPIYQR